MLLGSALVGCGGGGVHAYPVGAQNNYMRSCQAQPGAKYSICQCSLEYLEKRMPYSEFKVADVSVDTGLPLSHADKRLLVDAIAECG